MTLALSWQLPLLAMACAAVLTWWARRYALRRQLLDQPGERRSHVVATPRGGGIAIVVVMLVALLAGAWLEPGWAPRLLLFALGLVLVAGIGWWDDHRPLPALHRLLVHVVASLLLAGMILQATGSVVHAVLVFVFTVSLVNIWNFMDGINGIAASQAALAALAYALMGPPAMAVGGLVLAGACLGFLPFNFPRARIFLGDVGSGALGYLVAGLLALASMGGADGWLLLLLPIGAFCVDAGFTLISRILAGERWMQPHAQHAYQRWVQAGAGHATVTLAYAAFSIAGITLALASSVVLQPMWGAVVSVAWLCGAAGFWFVLRRGHNARKDP